MSASPLPCNEFPCIDCLKFASCRTRVITTKIRTPKDHPNYPGAKHARIGITIRLLTTRCIELYEFLYNKTELIKNRDTKQNELHAAINLCRVDVVRDYYFNY